MKNKVVLLAISGSLLLASPALRAEGPPAKKPGGGPPHGQRAPRGENLLPKSVTAKLNLSDDQSKKIEAIEESWDKARKEYMDSHKAEAEAAKAAREEARKSDDPEKKKVAAEKSRQVYAGLKPIRDQYMDQVRSVLSDEQKKILEEERKSRGGPPGARGPKPDKDKPKTEEAKP